MADPKFAQRRVLVVDDDPVTQRIVGRILNSAGIGQIDVAAEGTEAAAMLREKPADLIICDLSMLPLGGVGFIKQLRRGDIGHDKDIPVLVLTNHRDLDSIREASEAGASDYLVKPIPKQALVERLRRLFTA